MNNKQKTAIILGATGLTGGILLQILLEDPRYRKVKLFSRAAVGYRHPRMEETLGDIFSLDRFKDAFKGDEVYCCIGTTRAQTPDKESYRSIDYGIPVAASRLAKQNGIETYLAISALGANPQSRLFYNRTKGEMEAEILRQNISRTFILRPALLTGKRKKKRPGEWIAGQLMKALNIVMVGPLDKFRSIYPEDIARCMVWLANNPFDKAIIPSDEIHRLSLKYKY
jgi:uncharacterized protein YbjT (DUF2867 family)